MRRSTLLARGGRPRFFPDCTSRSTARTALFFFAPAWLVLLLLSFGPAARCSVSGLRPRLLDGIELRLPGGLPRRFALSLLELAGRPRRDAGLSAAGRVGACTLVSLECVHQGR